MKDVTEIPVGLNTLDELSLKELNAKLQKGYDEATAGMGESLNTVFDELEKTIDSKK